MVSTVYIVEGSEDGITGVYSNAKSAIESASLYVRGEYEHPAWCEGLDVRTHKGLKQARRQLSNEGYCSIRRSEHSNICAEITRWDISR